ncbi:hypothetical protein [Flavobacterium phage FCOV-F14]|uniref:Uncharacterized protein n=18 Tax=Ficleduovirus TaxID=2560131 RepID=A0A7G8L457_9CAUD|nr:hypothetical protein FDG55_gp69 [Flavobacterium phage FCV-1]ASD51651.1 hypothetical protein [Flavobacterium phage FCV-3]ASD51725.1 hypothetical protein [Flavobacterium phage FCV-11]ASD52555.1 hypothetical protein [Flavobacterium phage FCV-10]ASD52628.1 hypothetical protein [Flavobacterium phage FCV-16]ASD52702.1 hypothetical protein [Flavobacterium phage FCV-20]ASD53089.1 hypothetical protein [Flavobacterium phage VK20]ASD53163.1 hypothetical protein [Flavobacterium phage VK42]ASD53239.1
MRKQFKIRSLLKAKKQKFDVPQVTPLMKGDCVCESTCNEYCSNKKQINILGGEDFLKISDYTIVVQKPKNMNPIHIEFNQNYVQPINTKQK